MKYHYMRISPTTVRIELIPEDNMEKITLQKLAHSEIDDKELNTLFQKALNIYQPNAFLASKNFMDFPRVAICSFQFSTKLSEAVL